MQIKLLPDETPAFLSPRDVAALLGLSRRTIFRKIDAGLLLAIKTSASPQGRIRIPRKALEQFLESCAVR